MPKTRSSLLARGAELAPGLALCAAVSALAYGLALLETRLFDRAWLETLVLAILLGAALRTSWAPPPRFAPGMAFAAKSLLELAIVLLGLGVSAAALFAAGPALLGAIVVAVASAIAVSYAVGRGFGLPHKLSILIACGNSICGNSAIAAAAPVIRAHGDDVAASIAFTAVLGVIVVLTLPFAGHLLHLNAVQYGVFAGLTVYAVPQVLAATAPVGPISVQVGALVKLGRVLMLGPVLFVLAALGGEAKAARKPRWRELAPPFILGFLALLALRATGWVPEPVIALSGAAANGLTILAMAALGLSVDARTVAKAGLRVTFVVLASLLALGAISLALIYALHLH
jgi:uncharacterized integral membrane protein (TIGR00698 family)